MGQSQRFSVALTAVNVVLFIGMLIRDARPAGARQATEAVLRGRGLEIVDGSGQVRFSVSVERPVTEGGQRHPDRVLVRIGSPGEGPGLKLVSSAEGTSLGLMHGDRPRVHLSATSQGSFVKVVGADARERTLAP